MNVRFMIATGFAVLLLACSPGPIQLVGTGEVTIHKEQEVPIHKEQKAAGRPPAYSETQSIPLLYRVGDAQACPELDAQLLNSEVSAGQKFCYYIMTKD